MNQAREKTEKIIDVLHKKRQDKSAKKPRTYRKIAHKDYLEVAKQRRPSGKVRLRPIVRGKAGTPVEFGAKLSASCVDGYVFLDRISWDNFNKASDLKAQIEAFKEYTGYYPESVHVDKIYRNRENRAWCKERGIRISGPPLGRPPINISESTKKQALEDEKIRNCIEGKFGQGKRGFSLNPVMAKQMWVVIITIYLPLN